MTTHLYLAPAASGKTAYLVTRARALAQDPAMAPRVIVPTRLQARAWRARLAAEGGALGVQVGTFDDVYREVLRYAGAITTRLADPVQVRLLRTVIAGADLTTYDTIRRMPGFVQAVRDLVGELKAGGIFPEDLQVAIEALGAPPRLAELVRLYAAYQLRLQQENWADYAGVGWLTAEALDQHPALAADWTCVMVDGFDDLTTVQIRVLKALAPRVGEMIITLTGSSGDRPRTLVHKRFLRTRERLEAALSVQAQPLPVPHAHAGTAPALQHLEQTLYSDQPPARFVPADAVTMVAVPNREAEARAALRWLKTAIVRRHVRPGETALLARDLTPYRDFIVQIATEFGLPIHLATGHALGSNPAVAALLAVLQLAAPGDGHLAWRPIVAAWRSPYFDWAGATGGIALTDAEALARVARWGSVIGGRDQWEETFTLLREATDPGESRDEEAPEAPDTVSTGEEAEALYATFTRFCARITPPEGAHPYRDHVAWLEGLVGNTEDLDDEEPTTSLGIARQVGTGEAALVARDLAALNALKDVLRGLVWAEDAVEVAPVTFETFLDEVRGAVDAATYRVPLPPGADAVLAADVTQARGISFRAVAVLGMAEGEFPATLSEDPFLRDADRQQLRERHGLPVDGSPESLEAQYFYEAVTRPREMLLLTRPRIADNGAPWQASPFWEEVVRRLDVQPQSVTSANRPEPAAAASWPELLASVAARPEDTAAWTWVTAHQPALSDRIVHGQTVLAQRRQEAGGAFDGNLTAWEAIFTARFAPKRVWSASRLESYRQCPYLFFIGSVLGLEPRQPPAEGLDARQLGNIYHHIMEAVYRWVGPGAELPALLAALPTVAAAILDAAPRREQFRETAWWAQTRQEILDNVQRSVVALETLGDGYTFHEAERTFGIANRAGEALAVTDDAGDSFRVRGFIDRVDRDGAGHIRIIDYKTAGPWSYRNANVAKGEKLQLPLYALAAEEALELGQVTEGFYWHMQHAVASDFKLSRFRSDDRHGPRGAMDAVVTLAWEAVRGARQGHFVPVTPHGGCPGYCPAAAFCWHYEASGW